MASLTVQAVQGNAPTVSLAAATAGGDTTDLDETVQLRVTVGATATTVTVTPVGPYIKGAPAKVYTGLANTTRDIRVWNYPGHKGSPSLGRADVTYSQVVAVTVGAFTVHGG